MELAEQITLLDRVVFRSIPYEEFLGQGWMELDESERVPYIMKTSQRFNDTSDLVPEAVLGHRPEEQGRAPDRREVPTPVPQVLIAAAGPAQDLLALTDQEADPQVARELQDGRPGPSESSSASGLPATHSPAAPPRSRPGVHTSGASPAADTSELSPYRSPRRPGTSATASLEDRQQMAPTAPCHQRLLLQLPQPQQDTGVPQNSTAWRERVTKSSSYAGQPPIWS
ncbi:Ras-specific guanine nucleotide-releasing factor 2 [Heterocephalus glaber]|uniref:Ras-specific guanine nucleotide-releasing factor 2 n=1 Tax=Heterocephalus glaber TaxID=10181 RepID=G5AMK0_HETGA|nr:Ras-specific guanine nucleotide-releasing factor 2 [Heterocephalus glaber]